MQSSKNVIRLIAMFLALTLALAACGGDDSSQTGTGDGSEVAGDPQNPESIPTTPPVTAEDRENSALVSEIPTVDPCVFGGEECGNIEPRTLEEGFTTFLTVNDDVQVVPAFDAPHGNEITVVDKNAITGTELEYPLLATTYFGNKLVLKVEEFDPTGNWARVEIPVRPNNTTVWVQTAFFTEGKTDYRIEVNLTTNIAQVFKGDEEVLSQSVVTGRSEAPTPLLDSYIDEMIEGSKGGPAYGAWILSVAAYSEALPDFVGGLPKIALHGTDRPDQMGQDISSGCIRFPDDVITFIKENVPVGTPVKVVQ